jgi:hypothetical protein
MTEVEEPLFGGLVNGRVVRVGDTVRRPAGPWTATVQALLAHVTAARFPCPRPLGLDEAGRERVSFIPGRAGLWPWPQALLAPDGPRQAGAFVRAYHEAVRDFVPPSRPVWRHGVQSPAAGEIVLHGDFGPYNMIWDADRLVGLIDFELARPGRPIEDAAFAALRIAALRDDAATARYGFAAPPDRRARLAGFAAGYRISHGDLLAALIPCQVAELERIERLGGDGVEPWAGFLARGLARDARAELSWLADNLATLAP